MRTDTRNLLYSMGERRARNRGSLGRR